MQREKETMLADRKEDMLEMGLVLIHKGNRLERLLAL